MSFVWKLFTILYLRFLRSFSFDWEDIPRSSSNILSCASYFQLSCHCLEMWWNALPRVWYITYSLLSSQNWNFESCFLTETASKEVKCRTSDLYVFCLFLEGMGEARSPSNLSLVSRRSSVGVTEGARDENQNRSPRNSKAFLTPIIS